MQCEEYDFAKTLFAKSQAAKLQSSYAYCAMLECYACQKDVEGFNQLWDNMASSGCAPCAAAHASYCKLLAATQPPSAVYAHVQRLCTSERDCASGHALTIAFTTGAQDATVTFPLLKELWDAAGSAGVKVNGNLLSAFLAACKTCALEPQQVEQCYSIFTTFCEQHKKPAVGVLANMLHLCAAHGVGLRVLDIWKLVQKDMLRINAHVALTALLCCKAVATQSPHVRSIARQVRLWLQKRWLHTCMRATTAGLRNEDGMRIAFNALLAYYAAACDFQSSKSTLRFMCKNGPAPDLISFNSALHACGRCGNLDSAEHLLDQMQHWRLKPDQRSYSCMIAACSHRGQSEDAMRILADMDAAGVPPNAVAYTSVMHAHAYDGNAAALRKVCIRLLCGALMHLPCAFF